MRDKPFSAVSSSFNYAISAKSASYPCYVRRMWYSSQTLKLFLTFWPILYLPMTSVEQLGLNQHFQMHIPQNLFDTPDSLQYVNIMNITPVSGLFIFPSQTSLRVSNPDSTDRIAMSSAWRMRCHSWHVNMSELW
jgi:hypothetical protein